MLRENETDVVVGANVRIVRTAGNEVLRELYAEQMPTVNGGCLVIQDDDGALILPLENGTEVQVEFDYRPREEATVLMLTKMGFTEDEIEARLAQFAAEEAADATEGPADATEGPGTDAPIIRLDFGGSNEASEDEGETS